MNIEEFIKSSLPNSKQTFSRDAVEVLMKVAFEEGRKQGKNRASADLAEEERERQHGPMFI
jgi:hypothetical protein